MRKLSVLLTSTLIVFSHVNGSAQDKIYFNSGAKDGKTESITQSILTYLPTGKKKSPVAVSTKKLLLLFNKTGDFLAFERLDFSNEQTRKAISRFLNETNLPLTDHVYSLAKGRIDDKIITEDKNYIYLQRNGEKIDKKTIVAVVYKDGHHILYAPAEKAALVLWQNRPSPDDNQAKTDIKKEPTPVVAPTASTKPVEEPKKVEPVAVSPAPTPAPPVQKRAPDSISPRPLSFEDVAGNISKAEFEKKALQKTNQLNIYLKVICNKAANYEEINKAIDQAVGLFVDENAMIETSSVNRNDVKRYKIRSYLSHIKLVNYDKIEIEWTNVQYVSDVKQGPDGNYYGVVSFEQVFKGYRDGKLVYQDVTRKNTNVVLKTYEKNVDGNTQNVWDVLLSDIGVISTKSL
ncbi:MAG: hypothetical protein ABI813_15195 [Bacteroidota bacterium]